MKRKRTAAPPPPPGEDPLPLKAVVIVSDVDDIGGGGGDSPIELDPLWEEAKLRKESRRNPNSDNSSCNKDSIRKDRRPGSKKIEACASYGEQLSAFKEKEGPKTTPVKIVKKVKKMNATERFDVPANGGALRISDYFDVVDTPKDSGTICSNPEKGTDGVSGEGVVASTLANTKAVKTKKQGSIPLELHTPQGPQALTSAMVSIAPAASPSQDLPPAPQTQESDTAASTSAKGTGVSSLPVVSTRGRGQYKGLGLEKTNRQRGHKMVVNIELVQGRPLSVDQSAKLSSEIGLAARQCIPLSRDWRSLSRREKAPAFSQIQTRLHITGLMEDPIIYHHVNRRMGQIRRRWKHELKMEYEKSGDAAKPEWIQVDDWEAQTKIWCSVKGMAKAKMNQDTRKNKVKNIHNCGSRAYVPMLAEMAQQEGVEPDAIEFFRLTHYTAPGGKYPAGWKTPEAEANYNRMLQLQDEAIARGTPRMADDIVDEVMKAHERSDYRPGRGYGPPAVGTSSSQSCAYLAQLQEELQASQAREASLIARLESQERATAQVQSECAQVRTDYAQVQSNYAQLQAQLQVQHQMLQQIIASVKIFSASPGFGQSG